MIREVIGNDRMFPLTLDGWSGPCAACRSEVESRR